LKRPDSTEELNELSKFIDYAKSEGITKLTSRITDLKRVMAFLLDSCLLPQEDLDLNSQVLLWPYEIGPIFDRNEEVLA
jgi:hypothetical protein